MGPVVVTCVGCGVRIRVARLETALGRDCPRCGVPLALAFGQALGHPEPDEPVETQAPMARARSPRVLVPAIVVLGLVAMAVSLGLRNGSAPAPAVEARAGTQACPVGRPVCDPPSRASLAAPILARVEREGERIKTSAEAEAEEGPEPPAPPEPSPTVPVPPTTLAERRSVPPSPVDLLAERRSPLTIPRVRPPRPRALELAPPFAGAMVEEDGLPRRIRVRAEDGEPLIARVHGMIDDRVSVMLPDGQIGFSNGLAFADEPFQADSAEQIRDNLLRGPFAGFHVEQSAHYLVLYKSTDHFAQLSINLLENLYKNLTEALRKRDVPTHDPEFPLVAIIFRTEREFRAHKKVAPDVQAYYEILTNRIYLYQASERDQHSPEVAALRKPQTVAHEGTHQILQNIGVQPRLSDWPLWLVEGLAEYCSTPVSTREGATWRGLGIVNPMHMATIHDLENPMTLKVSGPGQSQRVGRDPRMPMVEYLVTRTELTPTDYALSWALTHYLAMKRGTDFLAFLKAMSQLPPLQKRTPAEQLASFRAAFGSDLARMDRIVAAHLAKLKYEPLPYYAVMFEQPVGGGIVHRAAMISQSPSYIRQWIETLTQLEGGPPIWQAFPHESRDQALLTAQQWVRVH